MAFKLVAMAEERGRKVNGLEPLVRAGVRFVEGVQETPKSPIVEEKENAAQVRGGKCSCPSARWLVAYGLLQLARLRPRPCT